MELTARIAQLSCSRWVERLPFIDHGISGLDGVEKLPQEARNGRIPGSEKCPKIKSFFP
jgi:hypothetical protein